MKWPLRARWLLLWTLVGAAIGLSSPGCAFAKSVTLIEFFGLSFAEGQRQTLSDGDAGVTVGSDFAVWSYANDYVTWQITRDVEPVLPGGWGVFPASTSEPSCGFGACNWITFFPFVGRTFLKGEIGSEFVDPALIVPESDSALIVLVGLVLTAIGSRLRRRCTNRAA